MRDDRLQGILFQASDSIVFADASTRSKRMLIKTRRAALKVNRFAHAYQLPIKHTLLRTGSSQRLRAHQTADVANRLKVS